MTKIGYRISSGVLLKLCLWEQFFPFVLKGSSHSFSKPFFLLCPMEMISELYAGLINTLSLLLHQLASFHPLIYTMSLTLVYSLKQSNFSWLWCTSTGAGLSPEKPCRHYFICVSVYHELFPFPGIHLFLLSFPFSLTLLGRVWPHLSIFSFRQGQRLNWISKMFVVRPSRVRDRKRAKRKRCFLK